MRKHLIQKKKEREMHLDSDKQFLNKVAQDEQSDVAARLRSSEVLKNEFLFFND